MSIYTKLVGPFCLLACGIAIATTRTFLTVHKIEEQISIVVYIRNFICRENYFSRFFAIFMMCTTIIAFCKMYISNQPEKATRFSLDSMSSKLFNIDQQLANNQISEEVFDETEGWDEVTWSQDNWKDWYGVDTDQELKDSQDIDDYWND